MLCYVTINKSFFDITYEMIGTLCHPKQLMFSISCFLLFHRSSIHQLLWKRRAGKCSKMSHFRLMEWTICVSSLPYGATTHWNVDQAKLQLFNKDNKDLEMLPPMRYTLALHICRTKQADDEHIQVPSPAEISAWKKTKLPGASVDKTTSSLRYLSSACHLCMQIQMLDSSMQLLPERSEMYSCLRLWQNTV